MPKPFKCLIAIMIAVNLGAVMAAQSSSVVAPGATVKKIQGGFDTTEGPAVDAGGNVYFTDKGSETIYKWTWSDNRITVHRKVEGGALGMAFDSKGRLLAAEKGADGEYRITADNLKGNVTVLADSVEGRKLIMTNTVWADPGGGVYFTEWSAGAPPGGGKPGGAPNGGAPNGGPSGSGNGQATAPGGGAPNGAATVDKRSGIDYIDPKTGKVIRAVELAGAHKVAVTPDGKRLYASGAGDTIYSYNVQADGTATGQQIFCKQHCEDLRFTDGIVIDERGNVYTISDKIFVYNSQGFKIEEIDLPEHSRNMRFAGKGRSTLFICGTNAVYTLEMAVVGPPSTLDLAKASGR